MLVCLQLINFFTQENISMQITFRVTLSLPNTFFIHSFGSWSKLNLERRN